LGEGKQGAPAKKIIQKILLAPCQSFHVVNLIRGGTEETSSDAVTISPSAIPVTILAPVGLSWVE
jgi:hypothetical protein